jgi:hypothetical protein
MQYTLPLPLISGTVVQKSNVLIGGRKKMEGYRNGYLKENLYFKMVYESMFIKLYADCILASKK